MTATIHLVAGLTGAGKCVRWLVTVGALLCVSMTAADASPSRATVLMLEAKRALGGAPSCDLPQVTLVGTQTLGGMAGTFSEAIDTCHGRDVTRFSVGPLTGVQATLTDSTWEADAGGLPLVHRGAGVSGQAALQSFIDRTGWFSLGPDRLALAGVREEQGRRYDLVNVSPPGLLSMTLWLDAGTHLPARLVTRDAGGSESTTLWTDYRRVDGRSYPFSIAQADGSSAQTVTSVAAGALDEASFLPPREKVHDARLIGGSPVLAQHFTVADGRILVPVSINGHAPLPFILDTGAVDTITPDAARSLGLSGSGQIAAAGVGPATDAAQGGVVKIAEVRLGPAEMRDQTFGVVALPGFLENRGEEPPIAGLLGYELLRRFPVRIDYASRTLTFSQPGATPPPHRRERRFPIRFPDHSPVATLQVQAAPGDFILDTGDSGGATLFPAFTHAHRIPLEQPSQLRPQGGVGGMNTSLTTRIPSLSLGPWRLRRPVVAMSSATSGIFADPFLAGNLGARFLRRFIVTYDYRNYRISVSPAPAWAERDSYNRAGLFLMRGKDGRVLVEQVNPATPAAGLPLAVGDAVLEVDGLSTADHPLDAIEKAFSRPAGHTVRLIFQHSGDQKRGSFVLRELLPFTGTLSPPALGEPAQSGTALRNARGKALMRSLG